MKNYFKSKPLRVFTVTASSFPRGVKAAHEKIRSMLPKDDKRRFFGISYSTPHGILYKAAAEEIFPGEGAKLGCETFDIPKGDYAGKVLHNWMDDTSVVGQAFTELLRTPRLDPKGFCLEEYLPNDEMMCLVKLSDKQSKPSKQTA